MGFLDSLLKTLGVKKGDVSEASPREEKSVSEEPSVSEDVSTTPSEEETKEEPPEQGV